LTRGQPYGCRGVAADWVGQELLGLPPGPGEEGWLLILCLLSQISRLKSFTCDPAGAVSAAVW